MSSGVILASIFAFTSVQQLLANRIQHEALKTILLGFVFSLEILVVYSSLYTEAEAAIEVCSKPIDTRNKDTTSLLVSPETICSVGLVYLISKVLIRNSSGFVMACLVPLVCVTPLWIGALLWKSKLRFQIREIKEVRRAKNLKLYLAGYASYLLSIAVILNFDLNLMVTQLFPLMACLLPFPIAIGVYSNHLICYLFSLNLLQNCACSVCLLLGLLLLRRQSIVYNSHQLTMNLMTVLGLMTGCVIYHLQSQTELQRFQKGIRSGFGLVAAQIAIIYVLVGLVVKVQTRSQEQPIALVDCFREQFTMGIRKDSLVIRNLQRVTSRLALVMILLINSVFPDSLIGLAIVVVLSLSESLTSLSVVAKGVSVFVSIMGVYIHVQGVTSVLAQHILLTMKSFGKSLSGDNLQSVNLNNIIHNFKSVNNNAYEQTFQSLISNYAPYSKLQLLSILIITGLTILMYRFRSRKDIHDLLRNTYIVVVPIGVLTIQSLEELQLHFYAVALVKVFQLYQTI